MKKMMASLSLVLFALAAPVAALAQDHAAPAAAVAPEVAQPNEAGAHEAAEHTATTSEDHGTGHEAKAEHGAAAAHGAGHGEVVIPNMVWWQFVNFALYAALLVYLLRKPIKNYFTSREVAFKSALTRAEAARKEAELKKTEIQQRLTALESTQSQSIAQARAEAEALKTKIVQEAQAMSASLKEEAKRTATFEIERAKSELRDELLNQSVALSTKMLQDRMSEPDQKRLQTEFVNKIEASS